MNNKLLGILKILSKPFIIFLLPFCGYLLTYFYEVGYYSYFGIPAEFIDLTLINIISALIVTFIVLPFFIPHLNNLLTGEGKITTINIYVVSISIIMIDQLMKYGLLSLGFLLALSIILLLIVCEFTYFKSQKMKHFFNFLLKDESFVYKYLKIPYFRFIALIIVFIAITNTFNTLGWLAASSFQLFNYISLKNNTYAVVGYYKDNMLLLPINMKTKTIRKELYIYNIDKLTVDNTSLNLHQLKDLKIK